MLPPLLAGKYEPVERVGRGGMGVVYRARDLTLARDVALKTLPRTTPEGAARMRREARAMAVDLWALSMVTYEAIAGRHPYGRGDAVSLMHRIASDSVPDLRDFDVSIPEPVASFLGGCLHRDASRRPASAHEWRRRAESLRSPR